MSSMTPNDLPSELVVKILVISLGQIDELDTTQRRWKVGLLKACSLISRAWVQVSQALLFRNVMIHRTRTLALFFRSLQGKKKLGKYVRRLSLGLPRWDHATPLQTSGLTERILNELDGLEELELKPPFNQLVNDSIVNRINSSTNIRKLNLKWGPKLQNTTNFVDPTLCKSVTQYKTTDLGSEDQDIQSKQTTSAPIDDFCKIVLPSTVEDLQLIQPSREFMLELPKILSNFLESESSSDRLVEQPGTATLIHDNKTEASKKKLKHGRNSDEQPKRRLKSFGLRFSDPKEVGFELYRKLPVVLSPILTTFSWCLNSEIENGVIIALLLMTPNLEHLKLSRVGLNRMSFRNLEPLNLLKSIDLTVCLPEERMADANDVNLNWIEFSDSITRFLEGSPLLERFEFDADLVQPSVLMTLLLELLYSATKDPASNHSRLKHLSVKHNDPMPASSVERLCNKAPLLESLNIKIETHALALIQIELLKLNQLKKVELNNFKIIKSQDSIVLDISPFYKFCEQRNRNKRELRVFRN